MNASEDQNAELSLSISTDKMQVLAHVTAALADGARIENAQLLDALAELGVPADRILIEHVPLLLSGEPAEGVCIASGFVSINGEDTRFIPLIDTSNLYQPHPDAQGVIDYFDTKTYLSVGLEAHLMRRVPPTPGAAGSNVLGQPIASVPGKNLLFKKCLGSGASADDSDLLIATVAGHPVLEEQGVRIDQTLVLTSADLDSGNIDYDGSVSIMGNVKPQVEVKATGDIFIKGTVEHASLIAGNHIVIGGGVIGDTLSGSKTVPEIKTRLRASGDIHALFLQQVEAIAGNDIFIKRYALHCHLSATNRLIVGEGGGKGVILGGCAEAGMEIQVNTVGSDAYIETHIRVGRLEKLIKEQARLDQELSQREAESQQLSVILVRLCPPGTTEQLGHLQLARAKKIKSVLTLLLARIARLKQRLKNIEIESLEAHAAFIQVNKKLYSNARVNVNGAHQIIRQEYTKTHIISGDNQLVFS